MRRLLKWTTALCLCCAALAAGCKAAGSNPDGKNRPGAPDGGGVGQTALAILTLKYAGSNINLVRGFAPDVFQYSVNTQLGHSTMTLNAAAISSDSHITIEPENVDFVSGQATPGAITPTPVGPEVFPVPVPDRDFYISPLPEGALEYHIKITVSADGAEPSVYTIWVFPPPPENPDLDVVNQKIAEAEQRLSQQEIVVGDPSQNTGDALLISATVSELNTLKAGTTETREVVTPEGTVIEEYQVYDYPAIVVKTRSLISLLDGFSGQIIVAEKYFDFKAEAQKVKLAHNAVYELELKGAAGGHIWTQNNLTQTGGKGGHIKARFDFNANTELAVRTGGTGEGTAMFDGSAYAKDTSKLWNAMRLGGWNGGGNGGSSSGAYTAGSGGGGASEIRLWADSAAASASFTLDDSDVRLVVAAGGGGAGQASGNGNRAIAGGNATQNGYAYYNGNAQTAYNPQPGAGDTAAGVNGRNSAESSNFDGEGRGGGGGGFKGGGALPQTSGTPTGNISHTGSIWLTGSGAGGTNHIKSTAKSVPAPVNEVDSQWGAGHAYVRWINNR